MTPSPCSSVEHLPPEAPSEQEWSRMSERADNELVWNPDPCNQDRVADAEAFLLERRGLTPQNQRPLRFKPRENGQAEFWKSQTIFKNAIAAKLRGAGHNRLAEKLELCHSYLTYAVCGDCGQVKRFPNRCDQHYCPECQPHLSHERKKQVEWWTQLIAQPKHVVLTIRNTTELTPEHIEELRAYLTALRRSAFATKKTFWWQSKRTGDLKRIKSWRPQSKDGWTLTSSPWRGGFYSLEITQEGKGWHPHFHLLVDCDYINQELLAAHWQRITRGASWIVKVQDCRDQSYLQEVTKYAAKGSQIACWRPQDIVTFIAALTGKRTFGVFGTLYGKRTQFAEFIATLKAARPKCDCGSSNVKYYDETSFILLDLKPDIQASPAPPIPDFEQIDILAEPILPPR